MSTTWPARFAPGPGARRDGKRMPPPNALALAGPRPDMGNRQARSRPAPARTARIALALLASLGVAILLL